jgi:hypothetical protein
MPGPLPPYPQCAACLCVARLSGDPAYSGGIERYRCGSGTDSRRSPATARRQWPAASIDAPVPVDMWGTAVVSCRTLCRYAGTSSSRRGAPRPHMSRAPPPLPSQYGGREDVAAWARAPICGQSRRPFCAGWGAGGERGAPHGQAGHEEPAFRNTLIGTAVLAPMPRARRPGSARPCRWRLPIMSLLGTSQWAVRQRYSHEPRERRDPCLGTRALPSDMGA